jgi:hypothetical protein
VGEQRGDALTAGKLGRRKTEGGNQVLMGGGTDEVAELGVERLSQAHILVPKTKGGVTAGGEAREVWLLKGCDLLDASQRGLRGQSGNREPGEGERIGLTALNRR